MLFGPIPKSCRPIGPEHASNHSWFEGGSIGSPTRPPPIFLGAVVPADTLATTASLIGSYGIRQADVLKNLRAHRASFVDMTKDKTQDSLFPSAAPPSHLQAGRLYLEASPHKVLLVFS